MKEVMTLQIGEFANFVGSHFWNFQDELMGLAEDPNRDDSFQSLGVDMDTLYRIGETRHGVETYTPRLIAIDLRGSLGAVRSCGSLYDQPLHGDSSSVTSWKGPVSTFKEEPIEKNLFLQRLDKEGESVQESNQYTGSISIQKGSGQSPLYTQADQEIGEDLENGVQFWTDYLKAYTHPYTFFEIQGAWHGLTPFQHFGTGRERLSEALLVEELENRLRFFIEDCDHLQGIQVSVDDSGGFAGVATDVLEGLMDEYGKLPVMLFTVRPPEMDLKSCSMKDSVVTILHDAVSFAKLSSLCSLMVPLNFHNFGSCELSRHLCVKENSFFHSSAIYAAAISNITLPFRIKSLGPLDICSSDIGSCDMGSMLSLLTWSPSRKVAELAVALPAPTISGVGESLDLSKMTSLSPFKSSNVHESISMEAVVFQGARQKGSKGRASVADVVNSTYASYRSRSKGINLAHLAVSICPLPIPFPFPRIFKTSIGRYGDILGDGSTQKQVQSGISSLPVAGKLKISQVAIPYIKQKYNDLQRFGLSGGSVGSFILQQWGFPTEEASELKEALSEMIVAFGDDMDTSSSDSD